MAMQQESAKSAKVAHAFGFESYSVGGIDFLTFLNSMQSYQDRQDTLYQYELEYYQAFVDFYSALGGGIPYRGISAESPVFKEAPPIQSGEAKELSSSGDTRRIYTQEGWFDNALTFSDSPWTVKLTGVYDRFAVDALMRDMPRRYESLKPAKRVLVEEIDVDASAAAGEAIWYSVNFTGFINESEAQTWCQQLRSQQQRCVVYQPEGNFEYIAQFDIDRLEKRAYQAGESILAQRPQAERESQTAQYKKAKGINSGRLYSFLKIENQHAILIGNISHRVWRFPVGSRLAYNGKLKSVNVNRAIVSFENRDYLLRPLYTVESVESGVAGQKFARMRWGGVSGELYYHRVGEKLYGGGIIKSIDAKSVSVVWAGQHISLPVMN